MSADAHDGGSSESSSGYEDGLGRRVLAFDRESGDMRERLRLRPELTAFARALQDRLPVIAGLEDERFAKPRSLEPDPDGRLSVLSEYVPGRRLSDVLEAAGDHGIVAGIDAGLGVLLELLPALSRLHDAGVTHGALAPGRIMITPGGQIVLLDAVYAEALQRLQLTRKRLWTELRLAFPSTAGAPRFDQAADLTQAAMVAAALIVGRPLRDDEYPDGIAALRKEIVEIASIRASKAFADGIDKFYGATLPLPTRKTALSSADEGAIDLRKLLRKEVGITTCRNAMIEFFQQVDAAERERAAAAGIDVDRRDAERIAAARVAQDRLASLTAEEAKAEADRNAREAADRKAREEAERKARDEADAKAREEAERKTREDAERHAREEAERNAREEAERQAREETERAAREEAERAAREQAERTAREETERKVREEAERKAREEAERKAREEAERQAREEAERKAREEAERKAREEAERKAREEAERQERERLEAERKVREEAERKAREEAERQAREEAERKAREEAERQAREEAERKVREEAERKAREEAERKAREEAERKAREEAERKAREEAERKARELAERKAREEAERLERERQEAERKAREEAERKERERLEAERKAKEEAERKAREEAERQAREEAERREREEAERRAREEAERIERERLEAERKAREEAERKERERLEAERQAREEAERKAREEAERKAREEAERRAREEAERQAREEAERQAREEAERRERERLEAERKAREEAERIEQERLEAERREQEALERIAKAEAEAERAERERIEHERQEAERRELENRDRIERARGEAARAERERIDEEQRERERAAIEARERAEQEARERIEAEARARAEAEARERAELEAHERAERERAEREARERAEQEAREHEIAVAAAASIDEPTAGGWLVPPDRAASFDAPVDEPPPPSSSASQAYPIYAPPAETESWMPDVEAPPAIEIDPVAAAAPGSGINLQNSPNAIPGIRLQDAPEHNLGGATRGASRQEPSSISAAEAYEPYGSVKEPQRFPWKLVAAGVVLIVITFAVTNIYLPQQVPVPTLAKAVQIQAPKAAPPPPPTTGPGHIAITSEPPGLRIVLDGKAVGNTPLTLDTVSPGRHVVTLQGAGGSIKRTVKVEAGKTLDIDVPVFSGFADISAPIVIDVAENGRAIGTSENQIILGPGRHELHFQNKELNYNETRSVDIEPGEATKVNVDPRGIANINAVPWANISIDGEDAGQTPLANVKIRLGVREIVFKNPQFPDRKVVVNVKSGTPVTVSVDFTKDK